MNCANCYAPQVGVFTTDSGDGQVNNGAYVRLTGYYGGFFDVDFSDDGMSDPAALLFCHDCMVRLAAAFPAVASALGDWAPFGAHPSSGSPCCDYSY